MPWQELENANQAIMRLVADNPDYEFTSLEEILRDGITIRWRKVESNMTTEQKRAALMKRYPGSMVIPKMPDHQVHAVYMRLLDRKNL
jgi:hypothetical protein